jgi:hypothetical protein
VELYSLQLFSNKFLQKIHFEISPCYGCIILLSLTPLCEHTNIYIFLNLRTLWFFIVWGGYEKAAINKKKRLVNVMTVFNAIIIAPIMYETLKWEITQEKVKFSSCTNPL